MKRIILFTSIYLILPFLVFAQRTGTVTATLTDAETGDPVPGAVVEVSPASDTTQVRYVTSIFGGAINIPGLAYGDYRLKITFLGYENLIKNVVVDRSSVNLDKIALRQQAQMIQEVVAEGYAMRTSQKGDTVVYNADTFKVTQDADAETLISKMPGITVKDGSVEAQGETVQKVYVDGKEFFGEDVNAAIKNIPAEIIESIEVYNKLSDQAEFTGVDDGEGYKAMNIVTNNRADRGQFGKVYAGYGFNDKYIAGGNVNFFSGERRITVMANVNNVNNQNFSTEDILGAMSTGGGRSRGGGNMVFSQPGINNVQAFGLNYTNKWSDKLEISANYSFNNSNNDNLSNTDRTYFSETDTYRSYLSDSDSERENQGHNFNARIEYNPNKNHSIMLRPRFSYQNFNSDSYRTGLSHDVTDLDSILVYSELNDRTNKNWGYNVGNTLIYRVNLGKPGRSISTDLSFNYSTNDAKGLSHTEIKNQEETPPLDSLSRQRTRSNSKSYNLSGNIMYTEPLTQYSQIRAEYRVTYRYSDLDRKSYLWDRINEVFYGYFDEDYSSVNNSGYTTHRVGPGYNWTKDRNVVTGNIQYEHATLTNDREFPTPASKINASFDNVVYFLRLDRTFTPGTSLRLNARSSTNNPSASQLQNVPDISNPLFLTSGNPGLKPSYNHNAFARFLRTNIAKGSTFMAMAGYSLENNYIADSTVTHRAGDPSMTLPNGLVLENGAEFTKPVNMNGYWRMNGMVSFGIPVKLIKSNVNFNLGVAYSESPSTINGSRNIQASQSYNGGMVVGSNISQNIDFTVSYNGGYNITNSSIATGSNSGDNEYFSQMVSARIKLVLWAGFTFSGNMAYSQYKGITDDFNSEALLCNLYIGKKVFRNGRGEVTFGVNDLLDQQDAFRRNITSRYIENVRNNILGRYFGFQFIYNIRNFGKGASASKYRQEMESGSPRGNSPQGPPPGGHRPF